MAKNKEEWPQIKKFVFWITIWKVEKLVQQKLHFLLPYRRVSDMVFDNNEYDRDANRNNAVARIQALRAASCVKVLGKGVIRVVRRVDDATENKNLGEYYIIYK